MVGKHTRRAIPLVSATLTILGSVIAYKLTESLSTSQSWGIVGAWMALGIIVTYLVSQLQARSQEEPSEAIKERVSDLKTDLRSQVQSRSYGARRDLIEAPLKELDLDVEPRMGWVRDHRLAESDLISETLVGIVDAFESSERRLLIVGEPGSGKTMAAYSLIEHLDKTEGDERIPLLVNLSAWEAQDSFEAFLIDYLCSSVGYGVRQRSLASAFISSRQYTLILDGLDEIYAEVRTNFSERLDEFVGGLLSEVGVVVTCRTKEYEVLLADYPKRLALVQAVEIRPLTDEQLDKAFMRLAEERDKGWEEYLSQRDLTAYQRVRDMLSNPLFLNLAVVGRLSPGQLLDWSTSEQELGDLVLGGYLDRTLADQNQYEPAEARRYLAWIARFLNGAEVSPFGLKTSDFTVFDLANLTPPDPPRRYQLFGGLVFGLVYGLVTGLSVTLAFGLMFGLVGGLVFGLPTGWPFKHAAVSSRLTLVWPSTRRQHLNFLRRAGRGLIWGLVFGLFYGLVTGLVYGLVYGRIVGLLTQLGAGLFVGLVYGLVFGLVVALGFGLLENRSVLITARTPKEARSRSLTAALIWLLSGLVAGLVLVLFYGLVVGLAMGAGWLLSGLLLGLVAGLVLALRTGGWFVLLQEVAHRHLARAGKLPPRPYDFLEWGIERQIFRRVGGGVRFRHNLIQQHLANSSEGVR